jgi:general secretion pathway protein G
MRVPKKHPRITSQPIERVHEQRLGPIGSEPRRTGTDGGGRGSRLRLVFAALVVCMLVLAGGILIAISRLPTIRSAARSGVDWRRSRVAGELQALRDGLDEYHWDCGFYPPESNGLTALVLKLGNSKWNGPYVNMIKRDPWNHPYIYRATEGGYVLKSLGADGIENTPDDCFPSPPETNVAPAAAGNP